MEEPQEEMPVEGEELVLSLAGLHHLQPVAQVILVAVQKALLLDEVDEHQSVEHQGGVPCPIVFGRDTLHELEEGGMFLLEAVVEPLGNLVHVERGLALPAASRTVSFSSSSSVNSRACNFWISASPGWLRW